MRNDWDIEVDSSLEKIGNGNEMNRKWTIAFPVFEVNILKGLSMRVFVQNFRSIGWEMAEI